MRPEDRRLLKVSLLISVAGALLVAGIALGSMPFVLWYTRQKLVHGVEVGMTRSAVIDRLGAPHDTYTGDAELRKAAEGGGYVPIPTAHVEKEVLDYRSFVWRVYVYIDRNDRVTRVFLART